MILLTQLLTGFSIVSAVILLVAYVFLLKHVRKSAVGILACTALLLAIIGLQFCHLLHWQNGFDPVTARIYVLFALLAPPGFFFFSRDVLLPGTERSALELLHLVPLSLGLFIAPEIMLPVAFTVGAGYTIWFARFVYGMRRNVGRFRFEMFFFGLFALMALAILALVALIPTVGPTLFYILYANAIGVSMALIVAALIVFPQLLSDIADVATLTYAKTTLNDVNIDQSLARLDALMQDDKLYQNENLNLRVVADALDLSSHQLSELINRHKGTGFSSYIRVQRVEEAKRLLMEDTSISVLSVSLTTGFKSQSNFYAAFREMTGQTPAAYRKSARKG